MTCHSTLGSSEKYDSSPGHGMTASVSHVRNSITEVGGLCPWTQADDHREEGHIRDKTGVAFECAHQSPAAYLPDFYRKVAAAANQNRTFWVKRDGVDPPRVAFEAANLFAAARLPEPYSIIVTSTG